MSISGSNYTTYEHYNFELNDVDLYSTKKWLINLSRIRLMKFKFASISSKRTRVFDAFV